MNTQRIRLGLLCLAIATPLTACSSSPAATRPSADEADWSVATVPRGLAAQGTLLDIVATTPPAFDGDPMLYAGSVAIPGGGRRAAVWLPRRNRLGPAIALGSADDSRALQVITDEVLSSDVTEVLTESWAHGTTSVGLFRSQDRRHWSAVSVDRRFERTGLRVRALVDADTAIAIDGDHHVAGVDLTDGSADPIELPTRFVADDVTTAAATEDHPAIAIVRGRESDGSHAAVSVRRAAGHWTVGVPLPGSDVDVTGVVHTTFGYVATGSRYLGGRDVPAGWVSTDGLHWRSQDPPRIAMGGGWSGYAGPPAASFSDDDALVPIVSDASLGAGMVQYCTCLHAHPAWRRYPGLGSFTSPGADTLLTTTRDQLAVVRSDGHRLQLGTWTFPGDWRARSVEDGTAALEWWGTSYDVGGRAVLMGGRTEVTVRKDGWVRMPVVAPYHLRGGRLVRAPWSPDALRRAGQVTGASGPDGRSVVPGAVYRAHALGDGHDASDLIGFVGSGSSWSQATGLIGPRTEDLTSVSAVRGGYAAAGSDRADAAAGHQHGALWTSSDGRIWHRRAGDLDPDRRFSSGLSAVCSTPDGRLLALGWVQTAHVDRPLALTGGITTGRLRATSLTGIGGGMTSYDACASSPTATVVLGTAVSGSVWVTHDGTRYVSASIGGEQDEVAEVIVFGEGFAAVGSVDAGTSVRPILWLSGDGEHWTSHEIPAEHRFDPASVVPDGDRLVVTGTGPDGPAVMVLADAAELLARR